jgi:NAD(P)-dependent dehydrogenase (short-subunit alcohol dehydrogenase family)
LLIDTDKSMTDNKPLENEWVRPWNNAAIEAEMCPQPQFQGSTYRPAAKLLGKVALISGGDSGIGRAVATFFAKEKANIAIIYLWEDQDAVETKQIVESEGQRCLLLRGDIGDESFCQSAVASTIAEFGHLDIVVNNAAEQHPQDSLENITAAQLERTFRTNVFGMFYLTKTALPHLSTGSTIINTTSVTAYTGNGWLLDYSATKGAIVSFTRSLSQSLMKRQIRVNGVAPGPVWTPLVAATFPGDDVSQFGAQVPMHRAAQPEEIAPSFVFLASEDSSYISGQFLHPNGGEIVNT